MGESNVWTLEALLARLMNKKKTNMHFGSLIMSCELIIDITKKVPNFVSFIASIVLNNTFGMKKKIIFIGLINKIRKMERVIT